MGITIWITGIHSEHASYSNGYINRTGLACRSHMASNELVTQHTPVHSENKCWLKMCPRNTTRLLFWIYRPNICFSKLWIRYDQTTSTTSRLSTLISEQQHEIGHSQYSVSGIKTPGFAPATCHTPVIFRPLPGSRHFKLKGVNFVS